MSWTRRFVVACGAVALLAGAAVLTASTPASAAAVTLTVNSLADTPDASAGNGTCATAANVCTLRAAIGEADAGSAANTYVIHFSVAGTTVPATELPTIDHATTIDGSTAPGYSVAAGPTFTIKTARGSGLACLKPAAASITIRALRLAGCASGIFQLTGAHLRVVGNQVSNNGAAFDATYVTDTAIQLTADDAIVGGTTAADRNVISGFLAKGVRVGPGATNAVVEGNYIGTNITGTAAIRNPDGTSLFNGASQTDGSESNADAVSAARGRNGVRAADTEDATGTPNTAVESQSPSATITKNVIAGNPGYGMSVFTAAANATITGNTIGAAADGTTLLNNYGFGISIQEQAHATVGGTAAGAGNEIVGTIAFGVGTYFAGGGITVDGSTATVQGNWIGTNAAGTAGLGNGGMGLEVSSTQTNSPTKVAAHGTIGGTAAGAGNVISGNHTYGVLLTGTTATEVSTATVQGNRIGTNPAGTAALTNPVGGISVSPHVAAAIGGTAAGAGNLVSGNGGNGIGVGDDGSGVTIQGNQVGTNLAGTAALPNGTGTGLGVGTAGVSASTTGAVGGTALVIGGTAAGARNLISGNAGAGIVLAGGFVVQGNRIGTNAAGTAALGNALAGIQIDQTLGNPPTIGGAAAGAGNLISANGFNGINVRNSVGYKVLGNTFGTNLAKTALLPNMYAQIFAAGASGQIGGPAAGEGNTIESGNTREGVQVNGKNIVMRGNLIHDTGGLSIQLSEHGPSASNGDQLPPLVSSFTVSPGSTSIAGTVRSDQAGPIIVDVYASNVCQSVFGSGEAKQYLGSISVPYAGGNVVQSFSGSVAASTVGSVITATATVPLNGTSQFSTCAATSDLAVSDQDNFKTAPVGGDVASKFTVTNNGPTPATGIVLGLTGVSGPMTAADQAWADTPSQGSVNLAGGTWAIGSLASGASATVCIRADIVRSTYSFSFPGLPDPLDVPALFSVQATTEGSPALDPFTGNNRTEGDITVGPAVAGASVCPLPTLTIDDASSTRPASGTTPMTFTVHLSAAQTRPVTVHYATQNGTAVAVEDYTATTGDLTIPAGQASKTFTVPVVGNQSDEPDKAFTVNLTAPKHAALADTSATGTVKANHLLGGCPTGSTSVQRFVCHLYFDALGRTPDKSGFTYWVGKLNKGTPRSTMAKSYLVQPESLRKVADRAYVLYLGRHGTNTELSGWATKLSKHTVSTQDIRISVLASSAYFARTGGTNTLYVKQMFQDVFRRPVDSSGLSYWTGQLNAGKTRTNVATRFMAEPEGRRKIVGDIYLRFLRRNPTTAEANNWVTQLSKGKTEVDVGIGLVASTEYFNRPQN